jgi:cytochrome c oxidase subunit 3
MEASTMTLERREPQRSPQLLPNSVLGMLLFVFTEIMLFSGLISAHVIYLSGRVGEMWPPPGQPRLPFQETALNTTALLVSGVVLLIARLAYAKSPRQALVPMAIAVLLGAYFVAAQGAEWLDLIREGLTMTSSTYGAFFYLIVGTHAVHAVAAILGLSWAWLRLNKGELSAAHFDTVGIFWYFVVLVWPVIYFQVYV